MSNSANLFPGVRVILVETTHPGNVGAAARAMKNMGLTELVLVKPYDFPSHKAIYRSASAEDVVNCARVVDTVEEARDHWRDYGQAEGRKNYTGYTWV